MFLFILCMECCGYANCLRIPVDREESNKRKDKRNYHGAIGKLSSEQQFLKSNTVTCCFM